MIRALLALFLAGGLTAGCSTGVGLPQTVALDNDLLSVRMSDNSLCRGPAPVGGTETGWSGRLQGCAWDYPYMVTLDSRANPVRMVLEEALGALGGADILQPVAHVVITDASGRTYSFASPTPRQE